jgi:hypothetical protein
MDTVFSEILGYGRVVHTPMEGIRVVPCNQQKDCNQDIYEYSWGLKGQRIYGQRPGKRRERISMMSGYHLGKLVAPFTWIGSWVLLALWCKVYKELL